MKKIFTLIAAVICTIATVNAQQAKSKNATWLRNHSVYENLQKVNKASFTKKTRAADQRLIAEAYEEISGVDSTTYAYSGPRGSILDAEFGIFFEDHNYDLSSMYYSGTTPPLYAKSGRTYNGNNLILVQHDSTFNGSTWDVTRTTNTYNATNQISNVLVEDWTGSAWVNNNMTDYTYAAGHPQTILSKTWNTLTSTWDNSDKRDQVWTGNNLTEETYSFWAGVVWYAASKTLYTYNANNSVATATTQTVTPPNTTFENQFRISYTYNASNQITQYAFENWDNVANTWENNFRYSFVWNGNLISSANDESWDSATSTWEKIGRSTLTYNSNNYIVFDIYESWDNATSTYTYDPSNGDYQDRYYYENYNNNVAVKNVASIFGEVKIYPNPANDVLNIELEKTVSNTSDILVLDMKGTIVAKSSLASQARTGSISLIGLAAGNYFVKVSTSNSESFVLKFTKN